MSAKNDHGPGFPEPSHKHQCWNCHRTWVGYGSHFGNRAICNDDPITKCYLCLAKDFPNVQMRPSKAYREMRASMVEEAAKFTNMKVGMLTNGAVRTEWTRTFLRRMTKLAARI